MGKIDKYRGVFPAFYACYDDSGRISPDRTRAMARFLIGKGVDGLYVCGSSGECIYQTKEERMLALESVMEEAKGKVTVIAHVAATSTGESVELAQHAAFCGVDALAAIPPIYFKLPEYSIEQYWKAMIDATDLDFIIYNIPGTTGYALSMDLFKKMLAYDKVRGIKNSSMPAQDIERFKRVGGEDFAVFNGPDEQFVAGRIIGADGGIGGTYSVMPELFLKANQFIEDGNAKMAGEIQHAVNDIIFTMTGCHGNMYSVAKEILRIQGIDIGRARLPLSPFTEEDVPAIKRCAKMIENAIQKYCG